MGFEASEFVDALESHIFSHLQYVVFVSTFGGWRSGHPISSTGNQFIRVRPGLCSLVDWSLQTVNQRS